MPSRIAATGAAGGGDAGGRTMRCVADVHYNVVRESTAKWWQDHDDYDGPIKALQCKFCDFEVLKRYTGKPKSSKSGLGRYNRMKSSKSGLGRYNRMRGQMVKHLHEEHREALAEALGQEAE